MSSSLRKATLPQIDDRKLSVPEVLLYLGRAVQVARSFEQASIDPQDGDALRRELIPAFDRLVCFTIDLLDQLGAHYEPDVDAERGDAALFEFADDDADELDDQGIDNPDIRAARSSAIVDLCFVGRMDLAQAARELRATQPEDDEDTVLARCTRCRGAIVNVATAADKRVCERERWTRTLTAEPELRESLVVRRVYRVLHDTIMAQRVEGPEDLPATLDAARQAVLGTLEPTVRRLIRVTDRNQLELLNWKLADWLEGEGGRKLDAGAVLWEDVKIVAEMLMQINNRQELIDHDQLVVKQLLARLRGSSSAEPVAADALLEALQPLAGRDPELDRMITLLEHGVCQVLVLHLERIAAALSPENASMEPIAAGPLA